MLKSIGHIFMLFAVLLSTTGISMHKHYSDGKVYSFALFTEAESCCETDCDCCTDEVEFVKLDTDFINSGNYDVPVKKPETITEILFSVMVNEHRHAYENAAKISFQNLSPPKIIDIKSFTQVFLC